MEKVIKNEVPIIIGGKERILRASFDALQGIEGRLGNVMMLISKVTSGDVGVTQCTIVVYYGLIGNGDTRGFKDGETLSIEAVGNEVLKMGIGKAMKPVSDFLTLALAGVEVPLDEAPAK